MKASPMSLFEEFIKEAYGSQYVIPVYQRNYTWKKNKQVKQLLNDIKRILDKESKRHFIGTIVYVIVDTDFIVRERAVVDGQQRLITMFLIAHALKEIANEKGETDISRILTTSYLENSASNEYKYRLRPSISDDDAYAYIAKGIPEEYTGQQSRDSIIMTNYIYIKSVIATYVDEYGLMNVINAIRQIYVVRIELDDSDDAQQIFESINSTGEKLTAADLIRNFIMMNKTNEIQEDIYNKYWLKLEQIFPESKKMAEFFRFYLAAKTFVLIPEKDLYEAFKNYWSHLTSTASHNEVLTDILNYAKHFERLYLATNFDVLGEALVDYRRMQSLMPAPFMMQILEYLRCEKINDEQTRSILQLLNTYLVRRYIAGQDTSAISRFFPGYLKNIVVQLEKRGFTEIVDICIYFLVNDTRTKSTFMPDDDQVRNYLLTANAYTLQNIRWLLEKIENAGNPIKLDLSALSIEHIMPQTPNDYWNEVAQLTPEQYDVYVNKLGNLTLAAIPDNSKMQNFDFDYKKKILSSTKHLRLNASIYTKASWTVKDINNRTEELINRLLELFPYVSSTFTTKDDAKRFISLSRSEIIAHGYLHTDNKLTVYAGSMVRYNTAPNSETLQELREELVEKEIVICEGGIYKFTQDYTFSAPSTATDFILGGSNNGWIYWKDVDGNLINDSLR
jgi:hypothetical protein